MKKWNRIICLSCITAMTLAFCGCNNGSTAIGSSGSDSSDADSFQSETEPFTRERIAKFEAEVGTDFVGNTKVSSSVKGFSGTGYVDGFTGENDSASIMISVDEEAFYDLDMYVCVSGGYKENYVYLDDEYVGIIACKSSSFETITIPHVYITAGEHKLAVHGYWGYVNWDNVIIATSAPFDTSIYDVEATLVNANASDNAKRLMQYICDNYGKNVISGQYCSEGAFGKEMAVIMKTTGKLPAMLGLDMSEFSSSSQASDGSNTSVDKALAAWEENIIVTMCWHWLAPEKYVTGNWYSAFYKENTSIDLDKIMSGQDEEGYDLLVKDIKLCAEAFKPLKEADVPVLWRPLHEASGGWFWWGNCEAESYIKLYQLIYDIFVNEYELNNLIWVWNGQDPDWYVGDEYCDIIGEDIYPGKHVYTSQYQKYIAAVNEYTSARKIITLSENGCHFDPDLALRDGSMWSYFGTWEGEFICGDSAFNTLSEEYTEADMLKKVYNHENVITRDELPDLKTYSGE